MTVAAPSREGPRRSVRARLLLVEDDPSLRQAITVSLRRSGYEVQAHADGQEVDAAMGMLRPDLVILDVRLPAGDEGFDLAMRLRSTADVPILFATAADTLADRLRGFAVGGDDYLVKPFAVAELLARVRALLRRAGRLRSQPYQVHDLVVDEGNRVVYRDGNEIPLTRTEFELLTVLTRDPGRVFSKTQLLSLVWGFDGYDRNLVEVHVSALHGRRLIHTERGEGYVVRPSPMWSEGQAGCRPEVPA